MCKASVALVLAASAMSGASELVSSKTYGFVGTGTMSSAIVRGLATLDTPPAAIFISPRNAKKAAALRAAFPGLVTVAADNQAVVDASEVVFIGVLPTITEETCRALSFKPEHTVVSLVSTAPLDGLRAWCAPVPSESVVRAIPLPPVAKHKGATILTPPHALVSAIFESLGTAIPVATETLMRKMLPVTGLMGQFYAMQRATQAWVEGQGVPAEDAAKYVGAIFHCITYDTAEAKVETFDHLVKEQTPGGINEQVCWPPNQKKTDRVKLEGSGAKQCEASLACRPAAHSSAHSAYTNSGERS
jgi:pyrroline-5-carboxylate reductase